MTPASPLLWLLLADPAIPLDAAPVDPVQLDAITVTATRRERPVAETPAAVSVRGAPPAAPGLNLSEWLGGVPGLLVRDRNNYAQDTQVSIRGFGTRASFGIRGLRVYIDDIPATQPDGQSQVSHANLASAEQVEVLRGPFSALYGNSAGGVLRLSSGEGRDPAEATLGVAAGEQGDTRVSAGWRTRWREAGLVLGLSWLRSDGLRAQSAAERRSFNARWHHADAQGNAASLVLNHLDAPLAEDPLGLSLAQFRADPFQTTPQALAFDTRKTVRQTQAGGTVSRRVGQGARAVAMAYAGRRAVEQYLAIPPAAQASPLQSGGVVDLASTYAGGELRLEGDRGERFEWTLGLAVEDLSQARRGYENFVGARLGVRGALRRDERNRVTAVDPFAQARWALDDRFALLAGLRYSRLRFDSDDRYVRAGNPDDSGAVKFARWTPVAALQWQADPRLQAYLAIGSGFETPTLVELAYRPDGGSGPNLALRPARSRNLEAGLKWRPRPGQRIDLALFQTDTRDELVVATNLGGRATFANATRSRRRGLELEAQATLTDTLGLQFAWTTLDAEVREAYLACAGTPCAAPTRLVARGTPLAGVPRSLGWLQLDWTPGAEWQLFATLRHTGAATVDDAASARAPGYTLLDLGLSRAFGGGDPRGRWFLRVDNALDRRHVGSIISNDGNGRYYEPGAPRTAWLGFDWRWRAE
jgi:iron complex outermembrane receptor protein